jgi:hypothetical protein
MKHLVPLFLLALAGTPVWAEDQPLDLTMDFGLAVTSSPNLSSQEIIGIAGKNAFFEAVGEIEVNSDGKYGADIANFSTSKSFFDNYILINQGYTALHLGTVDLQFGRYAQYDTFDSPYSLFLNSEGHSALGGRIHYEDDFFSYESRWISLNQSSHFGSSDTPAAWTQVWNGSSYTTSTTGGGFPDRGANLKTFQFKFGDLKVGLQDAAVYTGRSFALEHFISPVPSYFIQYLATTAGRPWTTSGNENNLLGFWVQMTKDDYDWGLQVLIDDFSLHFLFPDSVPNNPWKAAWTFGGHWKNEYGRFGLFHAGALKYTFEPITTQTGQDGESSYGYTYFPDVEYSIGGGKFVSLAVSDNAIGYQHGENNLAVEFTYDNSFGHGLKWTTNLELLLAGSNSPANPWADDTTSDQTGGTRWLDDAVLQKSIVWTSDLRWTHDDWELYTAWKLGWIANVLGLRDANGTYTSTNASALDRYVKIFAPTSDSAPVFQLSVGATWHLDVSALQRSWSGAQ